MNCNLHLRCNLNMARAIVESSSSVVNEVATGEVNEKSEASSSSHNGFGPPMALVQNPNS